MITLSAANEAVRKLAAELEAEERAIAEAISAKAIGDGTGYWKRAHALRERLRVAVALRDAIEEMAE
ncbi:MAG: hypothetical protein M9939_26365 [Mesorhizobium sp.]|nr:hypothetical protein [Mesorhizobium sp.]MCO5085129.1 hypothetical protein [Rhizobiaceae bacterium]MCO5164617.1 hypothetical protein [Mesorhizobium sp.]